MVTIGTSNEWVGVEILTGDPGADDNYGGGRHGDVCLLGAEIGCYVFVLFLAFVVVFIEAGGIIYLDNNSNSNLINVKSETRVLNALEDAVSSQGLFFDRHPPLESGINGLEPKVEFV